MAGPRRRSGSRSNPSPASTRCARSRTSRANAVEVGDDRVLSNLSRTRARALMSTLLSAECIGVARWATDTAVGVRQDPRAVRQAHRPVPGHQAQVRGHDRRHRARHGRGVGRRARHRRGRSESQRLRVRRRGRRHAGTGRRAALRAGLHPGARWHRLHLGARHQRLLPARDRARGVLRPCCRLPAAGGRRRDHDRHAVDRHRPRPRHREAPRRDPRGSGCAEGDPARGAHDRDRRGRLGAAAPAQAVGPGGHADRADHHRAGVRDGPGEAARDGHRRVDHPVDRRLRHR